MFPFGMKIRRNSLSRINKATFQFLLYGPFPKRSVQGLDPRNILSEFFTDRGRCKGEAVAYEAVVNYRE